MPTLTPDLYKWGAAGFVALAALYYLARSFVKRGKAEQAAKEREDDARIYHDIAQEHANRPVTRRSLVDKLRDRAAEKRKAGDASSG